MRRFSFRAMLFALALAVQAVVSGGVMAGAPHGADETSISGHCDRAGTSDKSSPAGDGQHKHHCPDCQLCASVHAAFLPTLAHEEIVSSNAAAVSFALPALSPPASLNARTHKARAPPSFLA